MEIAKKTEPVKEFDPLAGIACNIRADGSLMFGRVGEFKKVCERSGKSVLRPGCDYTYACGRDHFFRWFKKKLNSCWLITVVPNPNGRFTRHEHGNSVRVCSELTDQSAWCNWVPLPKRFDLKFKRTTEAVLTGGK